MADLNPTPNNALQIAHPRPEDSQDASSTAHPPVHIPLYRPFFSVAPAPAPAPSSFSAASLPPSRPPNPAHFASSIDSSPHPSNSRSTLRSRQYRVRLDAPPGPAPFDPSIPRSPFPEESAGEERLNEIYDILVRMENSLPQRAAAPAGGRTLDEVYDVLVRMQEQNVADKDARIKELEEEVKALKKELEGHKRLGQEVRNELRRNVWLQSRRFVGRDNLE